MLRPLYHQKDSPWYTQSLWGQRRCGRCGDQTLAVQWYAITWQDGLFILALSTCAVARVLFNKQRMCTSLRLSFDISRPNAAQFKLLKIRYEETWNRISESRRYWRSVSVLTRTECGSNRNSTRTPTVLSTVCNSEVNLSDSYCYRSSA